MDGVRFNPKDTIFSLDIGTRSVIGTVGIVKDNKFFVVAESYVEHEERAMIDGQIHDITLVADAVSKVKKDLEEQLKFKLEEVAIAAAGRFLRTVSVKSEVSIDADREISKDIIRSLELTSVKKAEDRVNKQTAGRLYCVGYSVKNYYLNGYVISNLLDHKGETIAADVIATFLPRSVVDSLYAVMEKVNLQVISLTLEPIAAMEAAIPKNLRLLNLVLVDIGAGTSDIAITSKDAISAYGMVPLAGDEVTETIAQSYLVDFNTAERMKREVGVKEKINFIDIMGFDNEVGSEEIIKAIEPTVDKIAEKTASKIIELNGGKAPNAVFLVGGGAHTPMLRENLAEKLNVQLQRVGIKGREAVTECICQNNELGSTGVTVLGIALVTLKKLGNDFIDVYLNGSVVSLFNARKHTVMDLMLQAGMNPKVLMGKNGKNVKFTLNGIRRVAFGKLAKNALITVNGKSANIDSEIKERDKVEISYAKDGKKACARPLDYMQQYEGISFYLNNSIVNLEPICIVNQKKSHLDVELNEEDDVQIILPKSFGDFKNYFNQCEDGFNYSVNGEIISDNYELREGDRIEKVIPVHEEASDIVSYIEKEKVRNDVADNSIFVMVNDKNIELKGKDKYIFIDVFEYIDFNLTVANGHLILTLNDNKAGYYDILKNGDIIKIYWE